MIKIGSIVGFVVLMLLVTACGGSKNYVQEATPQAPMALASDSIKKAPETPSVHPIQKKYAPILGVEPEVLDNIELYTFIDKWLKTPYLMGGENQEGIDCSAFTQRLYVNVFDYLPERTAAKQYDAPSTDKFLGQEFLREGDMLFFKKPKVRNDAITHVGIYLKNNKFISASGYKGPEGFKGVKISDLTDPWWQERFICAGRKPLAIYKEKS